MEQRIILSSTSITAAEIFSRWEDWASQDDNVKYGMVIRQVGAEELGGGLSIPPYFFLQGGWRIRPMEADHDLVISGNLFVEGGGNPVVRTLGPYQVNVQLTVPVQAQGIDTSGTPAPTADQNALAVWGLLAAAAYPNGSFGEKLKLLQNLSDGDKADIAAKVWGQPVTDHTDPATLGGFLARKVLTIKTFLGLS